MHHQGWYVVTKRFGNQCCRFSQNIGHPDFFVFVFVLLVKKCVFCQSIPERFYVILRIKSLLIMPSMTAPCYYQNQSTEIPYTLNIALQKCCVS